jgi:hypothetical protein
MYIGFQFLAGVAMKRKGLWVVEPYSLARETRLGKYEYLSKGQAKLSAYFY